MATTNTMTDTSSEFARPEGGLLVLLPALPRLQIETVLANLTVSLPAENLLVATPEQLPSEAFPAFRIITAPEIASSWLLTAAEFGSAYQIAQKNNARAILMLGQEAGSLSSSGLRDLATMRTVVQAIGKPLNVVMSAADPSLTAAQMEEVGVKRLSVGEALSRLALAAFMKGAREMKEKGAFTWVRDAMPTKDLKDVFQA